MPWQAEVALVAGEMIVDDETGVLVPAYPEVFVTVPRQSGKTTLNLSWELDRAILWEPWDGKPQAISYTAQSGSEARKKFRYEHVPLIRRSELWAFVAKPRFAAEDTGLSFKNTANLSINSTSEDAGHGSTLDLAVLDEIFADHDYRREQAFGPAMATRLDFQLMLSSTAGDEKSTVYNAKRAAGRAAVSAGLRSGMAYFEFSAADDDDPSDPAVWRRNHPALGFTISERTIQAAWDRAQRAPEDEREEAIAEFCRGWLNIPRRTKGADRVIPDTVWEPVQDATAAPTGRLVFGVDADQGWAAIGVADPQLACELIDRREGTAWLLERLVELWERHRAPQVVDLSGPIGYLADQLAKRGVDVVKFNAPDTARATGAFVEQLVDRNVRVRPSQALTESALAATPHPLGDRYRWSRGVPGVEAASLNAVTFAVGHQLASNLEPADPLDNIW